MAKKDKTKEQKNQTQPTKKIEYRNFLCKVETREDEQHGTVIEGVPIVFNKRTDLGFCYETIEPTALDNADMRDVRFLVNHDTDQLPLARSRNNNANSTMQLSIEPDGLHIRADLDVENNQRAAELYSAVKRGDVSGMSFMFSVNDEEWSDLDSTHPVRHIRSIDKVYEVSAVTWPAYEDTSITARSLDSARASLDSEKKALDSARKTEELRREVIERANKLC